MKLQNYFALMAAIILFLTSCKEDKKEDPPTNTKAELAFHFDHKMGTSDFDLNKDFVLGTGETVNLNFAKFYISGITLLDDLGNETPIDKYILVDHHTHHVEIGKFDPQHVHMVRFNIGVDSAANHLDPLTYEASHPLAPKSPTMHWAWASGYIFSKFEGTVDVNSDGAVDDTLVYHIGLDMMLRNVTGKQHVDIEAGEELTVDIEIDYAKIFDGLDLTTEVSTRSFNDPVLAEKVANNFQNAITIK